MHRIKGDVHDGMDSNGAPDDAVARDLPVTDDLDDLDEIDMAHRVRLRAERERDALAAFLARLAHGGTIVSTDMLTPLQIAIARAADRVLVTPDGLGFVYVPGPRTVSEDVGDLAEAQARLASEQDLNEKLEMELRRLRAAEAPGTDDAAVAPWENAGGDDRVVWRHWLAPGRAVIVSPHAGGWRWFGKDTGWSDPPLSVALDAMRAAVPGSV